MDYSIIDTMELLELLETSTLKVQKLIIKELNDRHAHATTEYID